MLLTMDIFGQQSQLLQFLIICFFGSNQMERKGLLSQTLICVILLLAQIHGYKSCIQKERKALLELKQYLISISEERALHFVLPTWTNDSKSDCCRWDGIKCNRTRVIGISIADIFYFKESSLFNLSLLHPFEEVRSLNLSGAIEPFIGLFDDVEGYNSLRRLRKLEILDLSSNAFDKSIFPFLNAATSLTTLVIQSNYMDGSLPVNELKDLTNLELLDLSENSFNGSKQVVEFAHMKKLKALDLSHNDFSSSMELQELKNHTNLEVLGLGWNFFFYEPIPLEVFCEMKNLLELDLSGNYFAGQIPPCLGSLNKLRFLDLSTNLFSGNLPSSFSSLQSLEFLSLADSNFTGLFSFSPLANLTKLKVLKLSSPVSMVEVEPEISWEPLFQLGVVVLPFCNLENIPKFLINQKNLHLVDLSNNKLSGDIPTWLFENNPELEVLRLQSNSFTTFKISAIMHNLQVLDFSNNDIIGVLPDNIGHLLPSLLHMNGSDNLFQGNFPSSMGEMKNISFLDLSYNNFSGEIPRSFVVGCFSLQFLKLSHNKFSGKFLPRRTRFTALSMLRINNNSFTGKIGVGLLSSSTTLSLLDMSNNCLSGAIPSWMSKLSLLQYVLVSNNFLEGTIPPSLLVFCYLSVLDLSGNLLSGALPSHIRGSYEGTMLFLQDNNFTGQIPDTLLENVNILDLRNNKLSGSIPEFVNPGDVSALLLRGNNLTGSIPSKLCDLSNITLLDLSENKLNGFIPSCLSNLSFALGGEEESGRYMELSSIDDLQLEFYTSRFVVDTLVLIYFTYMEIEIQFAAKQRYDSYIGGSEFSEGTLDYMYGLDLSRNELGGVIPAELGNLPKIRAMNLSHNFLSSSIPDSFSKLKDIESLDLSYNMLHGNIPRQLTNLTSLAVFNVSYNNLSGIIPQGVQFNTFTEDSYLGNPLLCGTPTNRSCQSKKSQEEGDNNEGEEEDEAYIDMMVFYWSTASTCVVTLIGILVLMFFDCFCRRAWIHLVDAFIASAKSLFS